MEVIEASGAITECLAVAACPLGNILRTATINVRAISALVINLRRFIVVFLLTQLM
jgi:hypothetical protein